MTAMTAPLPAYILAGGASRRFGSDKARAAINGRPLIARIADALAPFASNITAVAAAPGRYHDLGLRTIADRRPGLGPLAGLDAALHDAPRGWLLLCSCDMLELRPHWLKALLETCDAARGNAPQDAEAIAFAGERWQPFPALYHARIAPRVEAALDAGDGSMQSLLDGAPARRLPLPGDWPATPGANTPADLQAFTRARTPGSPPAAPPA